MRLRYSVGVLVASHARGAAVGLPRGIFAPRDLPQLAGEWGMTWPVGRLPFPPELAADHGEPLGPCVETSSGHFTRAYSKGGNVTFDCASLA